MTRPYVADVPVNKFFAIVVALIFALLVLFGVMRTHEAVHHEPLPGTAWMTGVEQKPQGDCFAYIQVSDDPALNGQTAVSCS